MANTILVVDDEKNIVKLARLYLGNELMNINALGKVLQAKMPAGQHSVFVRCDESVPFGTFATVMDTIRRAGIENISVVTEPLREQRRS